MSSWYDPPFELSWRELLLLLRLPLLWTAVTAVAFFATLMAIQSQSQLRLDTALAAAQVFLGVAGVGAFLLAAAALGAQAKIPRARLELVVEDEFNRLLVRVTNVGNTNAEGVSVLIADFDGKPDKLVSAPHWTEVYDPDGEYLELAYTRTLPRGGTVEPPIFEIRDCRFVSAGASNADTVTWDQTEVGLVEAIASKPPKAER